VDALDLRPDGYGGTYKLIGGRPALDLVNTVSWPDRPRRHDWFSSPVNVERWLRAVGLPARRVTAGDLGAIAGVRAAVTEVIRPLARGAAPRRGAVEALNPLVQAAASRRRIDPATLGWTWPRAASATELFDPVLADAADIVTTDWGGRLKHCPSCDWVFLDETRNGRRRWCDMADCGSRAKARDYYHRQRDERPRR
jgi:predicted RNA-binding Zn ribbon-like protein